MSLTDSLKAFTVPEAPDFSIEKMLMQSGKHMIAGVDEAGRGPLAGPVTAAAVILNPNHFPLGLNDSKKLTEKSRAQLFDEIVKSSHVAWCSLNAYTIDAINIRAATLKAMTTCVNALPVQPDCVMIDGRDVPEGLRNIGHAFIKGDARSISISAASIVAKVIRDRMMQEAGKHFPEYGLEKHKGYGSKTHRDAIAEFGGSPLHRKTFAPLKNMLEDGS